MPVTFVDAVNSTLKRTGAIQGDTGVLGTTTGATASEIFTSDSNLQHRVDVTLQIWQETVQEVYSLQLVPPLLATATIVTVADQREYDLPADFERVAGRKPEERVMRGATNSFVLSEYPGGYLKMLADQPVASDWTGQPTSWANSPRLATLIRIDRTPDSNTASETYNLAYEKRIDLTSTMATETMPFSDTVTNALVPVVAEMAERQIKHEFDSGIFTTALIRALSMGRKNQPRTGYAFRRV